MANRIATFLLLLVLSAPAFSQYVTVHAKLTDPSGSVPGAAFLHFALQNCGDNFPTVTATNTVMGVTSFDLKPSQTDGSILGQVVGNDQILCGNVASTYYQVTPMQNQTTPLGAPEDFVICSGSGQTCYPGFGNTWEFAQAQPMVDPPGVPGFTFILGNPKQSQSITQPVGTSLAFNGLLDFTGATAIGCSFCGSGGGGGASAAPPAGAVQFYSSGLFGGSSNLTWNSSTNTLNVGPTSTNNAGIQCNADPLSLSSGACLTLSPIATGGTSVKSQSVKFSALNSGGTPIFASFYLDAGGSLNSQKIGQAYYADQFASLQTAINTANPSGGGALIYLPCGYNGTWPTSGLTNLSLISLCAPINNSFAGSFGVSPNNVQTQVTLTSNSCITLTFVQNFHLVGVTIIQPVNCSFSLISSSWNIFLNDTLMGPNGAGTGGTTTPAMIWGVTGATCSPFNSSCSTLMNRFQNFQIICNFATNQYCNYALQVVGQGVINNGTAVTDNYIDGFFTGGNVMNAIDIERNTDSNHWRNLFLHTDIPGAANCGIVANQSLPGSDIDADSNDFTAVTVGTAFTHFICSGQSTGNFYEYQFAHNLANVFVLGGAPTYTAHIIGFFGWPGSWSSTYFRTNPQPYIGLFACDSTSEGTEAAVSDANTGTWGATITAGSGSNHVLAYCDGTNWTVAGK